MRGTVTGLLASGSGPDEICAVAGCDRDDLDWLCRQAFGQRFEDVRQRFKLVGDANFYKALYDAALTGNAKAIDTYARMRLDYAPHVGRPRGTGRPKEEKQTEKLEL